MQALWSRKLEWQAALFAPRLRRAQLLGLSGDWPKQACSVRVWRNLPFEYIAQGLTPFLDFAGYAATPSYSDYDDAFSLQGFVDADLHIVAFDIDRYSASFRQAELDAWFGQQLRTLRTQTQKPILVLNWFSETLEVTQHNEALQEAGAAIPDVFVVDAQALCQQLGPEFWDPRARGIRACGWSDAGMLQLARELGLRQIPALLGRMIKAIVVDFDDTLVAGVLGEDGIHGVQVTDWHRELQLQLKAAQANGVLLALASRNIASDLEAYFAQSADSILRRADFAAFEVSWDAKSAAVARIAKQFNIGTDAILFIDDNIGQLAEVAEHVPNCQILIASAATVAGAKLYPGVHKLRRNKEDELRNADIVANQARAELAERATSPDDYLRSLAVALQFQHNAPESLGRLAELSAKTNQFNLTLARLNETAIREYLARGGSAIAVSMRDRLSDSGIIAFVLASRVGADMELHELCISCRALGRNVERLIVFKALTLAVGTNPVRSISFRWVRGPRNMPALEWLAATTASECSGAHGVIRIPWNGASIAKLITDTPVEIEEN